MVSNKKEDLGTTPIFIDQRDLGRKLKVSLEGYETVEINEIKQNTIALRLNPDSGYNYEPVISPFIAVYNEDTLFIDPMEMEDRSRTYYCRDTDIKYRILGNSNNTLGMSLNGCGLTYLVRFSHTDIVLGGFYNSAEHPFPIQQKWVDISPLIDYSKKRELDLGRNKNQQMWYVLAKDGNSSLLMLPTERDPENEGRRAGPDLSGNIPGQFMFASYILQIDSSLSLITKENFSTLADRFGNNESLSKALSEFPDLNAFTYELIENPSLLGDIFTDTWAANQPVEQSKDLEALQEFLDNRKVTSNEPISIGGKQDYWIDSSQVVSETSTTPWFLKGEKDSSKTVKTDPLYYLPEQGITADSSEQKEIWYLRKEDDFEPYDAKTPRYENIYEKPKKPRKYADDKEWYLRKPRD